MTKLDIVRWTMTAEGKPYSFLMNYLQVQYPTKGAKLMKAAYRLALQGRVAPGNTVEQVNIDGRIVSVYELLNY